VSNLLAVISLRKNYYYRPPGSAILLFVGFVISVCRLAVQLESEKKKKKRSRQVASGECESIDLCVFSEFSSRKIVD
jgi:hypothetical protein